MKNPFSARWWISAPFLLGLLLLAFIIWVTLSAVVYPHDGIGNTSSSGVVTRIEPSGPTSNLLEDGDRIISVDGVAWKDVFAPYSDKRAGDTVDVLIERAGEQTLDHDSINFSASI